MHIVSDFLDRIAMRAIGAETMLSPRMPSFFEPARIASPGEQQPVSSPQEARSSIGMTYDPRAPAIPVSLRDGDAATQPVAAELHAEATLASPSMDAKALSRNASAPDMVAKPTSATKIEHGALSNTSHHETLMPRNSEVIHAPASATRTPQIVESFIDKPIQDHETGVLLPPAKPVFSALPATPMPRVPASKRSLASDGTALSQEPVVHVSIGRLEVRAAPTQNTAAPKRQETVRPSSLDDYLRQRGGKPA